MTPKIKVLYINNEPELLELCQHCLAGNDYDVVTAETLDQATETMLEQNVDIILLEPELPFSDDIEVLAQMFNAPVAYISANHDTAHERHGVGIPCPKEEVIALLKAMEPQVMANRALRNSEEAA